MVNEEIVGTEVNKDWVLDSGGDLALVKGSDNLSQAIYLRLTAYLNSLSWAYNDYGSTTKDWLGKNNNPYTRARLREEISRRVSQDPRVNSAEVVLQNWTAHSIGVKITAEVLDGTTFQEYFIFSDLARKDDNMNSPNWANTWIDTREGGYYAKAGEYINIHCLVRQKPDNRKVPIGEVGITIGGYHIDIPDNPVMVGQSDSDDPGGCTFYFKVPRFLRLGEHKLIFKYKGIKGYNNCVREIPLYVVERLPTSTNFVYMNPRQRVYFANDVDYFTDPVVNVRDINEYNVLHGQVRYYISDKEEEGEFVFLEFPIIYNNTILVRRGVYMYCKIEVLEYTTKFIFDVDYMFRPMEIIHLVAQDGTHIDYLEVGFQHDVFFLTSTAYTKPYEFIDKNGRRANVDRNDDIDIQRRWNTATTMRVVE